uniref:Uncharacterized protein n=1 Tax=Branchiostoma floridae TaxID=7739 RepID=C3YYM6_BRAFL|eukprot:XP_002598654.1 hypothetical protein BRAFLDRAFT_67054 [Branchiostoma floridae]
MQPELRALQSRAAGALTDLAEYVQKTWVDSSLFPHEGSKEEDNPPQEGRELLVLDIEREMLMLAEEVACSTTKTPTVNKRKMMLNTNNPSCPSCGIAKAPANPLVEAGIIPAYMTDIMTPIKESKSRLTRRVRPKAIVFDQNYLNTLKKRGRREGERERAADGIEEKGM